MATTSPILAAAPLVAARLGVVMRTRAPLLRTLVLAVLLAGRGSEAFAPGAGLAAPVASRASSPLMMPLGTPKVAYRPPGANSGDWIDIYNRLYRERIMFMGQPIMEDPVNQIIAVMLFLDSEEVKPMYMYINSPGGSVTAGFALYDTMNLVKSEISTINVGMAASMASLLLANGAKGKRLALPNSRTMIHQPSMGGLQGQAADIKVEAEMILSITDRICRYYSTLSGQPRERVLIDLDRDNFMDANEALAYGLVDQVLQKPTAKGELRTSSASI